MGNTIKLTTLTKTSGCAAKIGPGVLDSVLKIYLNLKIQIL